MEEKFLLISMEDERAKKLADVLGNKTCKKIIDLFAEKGELSEKDISDHLKMPLNTVEYNLKKLIAAELVEKTKTFFWSQKGKKIPTYNLSNKAIIISPKNSNLSSKLKSILPVAFVAGLASVALRQFYIYSSAAPQAFEESVSLKAAAFDMANEAAVESSNFFFSSPPSAWLWFLSGAVLVLILFSILNWRKL